MLDMGRSVSAPAALAVEQAICIVVWKFFYAEDAMNLLPSSIVPANVRCEGVAKIDRSLGTYILT
jgi:hypothetical protein